MPNPRPPTLLTTMRTYVRPHARVRLHDHRARSGSPVDGARERASHDQAAGWTGLLRVGAQAVASATVVRSAGPLGTRSGMAALSCACSIGCPDEAMSLRELVVPRLLILRGGGARRTAGPKLAATVRAGWTYRTGRMQLVDAGGVSSRRARSTWRACGEPSAPTAARPSPSPVAGRGRRRSRAWRRS